MGPEPRPQEGGGAGVRGLQGASLRDLTVLGELVPRAVGSLGSCELEHGVLVTGRPLPTARGLELGGGGGRPSASSHGGPCRPDHPKV